MKIAFNKQIVDGLWGGGNSMLKMFVKYFKEKGHQVTFSLDPDTDVVIVMDSRDSASSFSFDELKRFKQSKGVLVVHRINDNGSHRVNDSKRDEAIIRYDEIADKSIFISEWVSDYFSEKGMRPRETFVVHNGVDRSLFSPTTLVRKENTPIKIVSHHCSDNIAKGYDIYNHLETFCEQNPSICSFRFFGRCPDRYLVRCDRLPPQNYLDVHKYLKDMDVYITATRFEAGGCHIVEGMACGLIPLVNKYAGGPVNYSERFSILYKNQKEMTDAIVNLYNNHNEFVEMSNNVINNYTYSYKDMGQAYLDIMA